MPFSAHTSIGIEKKNPPPLGGYGLLSSWGLTAIDLYRRSKGRERSQRSEFITAEIKLSPRTPSISAAVWLSWMKFYKPYDMRDIRKVANQSHYPERLYLCLATALQKHRLPTTLPFVSTQSHKSKPLPWTSLILLADLLLFLSVSYC